MHIRSAMHSDAADIGRLHANSWRFAYRGALNDAYLDIEADADRAAFWDARLASPTPGQYVFVLVDETALIGFASVFLDHDAEFGSFLNNLHVAENALRQGCGTRLMAAVRDCCLTRSPLSPVYLWVVDSNHRAKAFYLGLGASFRGEEIWEPPGGGSALLHRLAWNDPGEIRLANWSSAQPARPARGSFSEPGS